jgi:glycosyltransferase involved in cell wall biosynthesis
MTVLPISIVIPSYNRIEVLLRCLPSYLEQGCSEVIVVDDCSSFPVENAIRTHLGAKKENCPLKVVRNSRRKQQPASRMVGVDIASNSYIFFGEDDAFLPSGYVSALYSWILSLKADACAAPWVTTYNYNLPDGPFLRAEHLEDIVDLSRISFKGHLVPVRPIPVPWLHSLALIKKQYIIETGFDSNYIGNAFREETDFYLNGHTNGKRQYFVPGLPAGHYKGPENTGGGQHGSSLCRKLIAYEYYVRINN